MKTTDKNSPIVDERVLEYRHPIFMQIEDGDEASIRYYKNAGIPVARIPLPHRPLHYYAILEGETQEYANKQNRGINNMNKKDTRTQQKESGQKDGVEVLSLDGLVADGFDAAKTGDDPEEVAAYKMMVDALYKAYGELTDEKRRFCEAVKDDRSDRHMAGEMGLAKSTYQGRKAKALGELGEKMRDWK